MVVGSYNVAFCLFSFSLEILPKSPQSLSLKGLREQSLIIVGEDQVWDYLRNLNIHTTMGPKVMHPTVLRELVDVVAKQLWIVMSVMKSSVTREKRSTTPTFKKGESVVFTSKVNEIATHHLPLWMGLNTGHVLQECSCFWHTLVHAHLLETKWCNKWKIEKAVWVSPGPSDRKLLP